MPNPFQMPGDNRIEYVDVGRAVISSLTKKRYPYSNRNRARAEAIERLKTEDTQLLRAADERLQGLLGRKPNLNEVRKHLAGELMNEAPPESAIIQTNAPTEDDRDGTSLLHGADLDNEKLWNKSPARRAMRKQLQAQAEAKAKARAAELEAQAEREARQSDPAWRSAMADAKFAIDLIRAKPEISEADLKIASLKLAGLESGALSPADYHADPISLSSQAGNAE